MSVAGYILAALGLAVLMIVHEGGHYLAARRFGMRVVKFSIGFGPTIWKHKPKDSPTTYQVAVIPFLAYVQIAGMNPYEENDPKDPGSYMNAKLWGRIVTIAAGPLTNYLFASILIFAGYMIGGKVDEEAMKTMHVQVDSGGPAARAGMITGDKILSVNGTEVHDWEELTAAISKNAGLPIPIVVEREGQAVTLEATPAPQGEKLDGKDVSGKILVRPPHTGVGTWEAAKLALIEPPAVVANTVHGIVRLIRGEENLAVSGPVGIVKTTKEYLELGPGEFLKFLGALSAYLGAFNLLPFPALDGGRLMFLLVEAISRRKPNPKMEARVHAVGLLLLLCVLVCVTYLDFAPKAQRAESPATTTSAAPSSSSSAPPPATSAEAPAAPP